MNPESRIGYELGYSNAIGLLTKTCLFLAALMVVMVGAPISSRADVPLVYNVENTGTNYPAPPLPTLGNLPLIVPLPDPFNWASDPLNVGGTRSTNFMDWEHHRNEIAAQIQHYEIGTKPVVNPSQVTAIYTNGVLIVKVTVGANSLTLTNQVSLPAGSGPFPVCIGMDSPYGSLPSGLFTGRNIAGITFHESQVSTYGNPLNTDPFFKLYGPTQNIDNTGQYAAWSWGVSRVIDALYQLNGTLGTNQIDLNHIAVTGCSYAGKLALFSGAFDERVALTIAQESGGGGANSWRYNHTEPAGTVELIDNTDYNWFANQMQQFLGNNVSYMPEDHHELDAMVAPRALYVTGNTDYTWLGNPSCYVCSRAVQQIYGTFGIPDRFGFNVDGGHPHCTFPNDQTNDLAYFLDKFMLGNTNLSSVIATSPGSYSNINYPVWYAWWGTTNPIFPTLIMNIPAAATEGVGTLAGQGSLAVNKTSTTDLVVNLTSGNTSAVTVPASVIIPAGQSNAVFDLTIIDDGVLSGDQVTTITATALGYTAAQANITVHDKETTTMSLILPASASKSAGTLSNAGSLSIGVPAGKNITIPLTSSDTSKLIVPANVVIPTGQTSAVFNLTVVDNTLIDGAQLVSVTAYVTGWSGGSNSMSILDYHAPPDHFVWNPVPSPQFAGQPFTVTNTAYDNNNYQVNFMLPVNLSAWAPGTAPVTGPATNNLLGTPTAQEITPGNAECTVGYSFTPGTNLVVTGVLSYFGDKVSLWTDSGVLLAAQPVASVEGTWVGTPLTNQVVLLAGVTYRVAAHVTNNGTFYWDDNLAATFPNGTINDSWSIAGDAFPNGADSGQYLVDLRYGTNVVSVPINPVVSGNFNYGVWRGNVAVLQPTANVTLQSSIPGHSGQSLPFTVINAPNLTIVATGGSVVISWPTVPAGFNLYQTYNLSGGSWTAVTNPLATVGGNYVITNTPSGTATFYRLRNP